MRKWIFILLLVFIGSVSYAQRYAYVNTEYILNNIPAYKAAQEKLDQLSYEWQQELETQKQELEKMEKEFQSEKVLLTDEMKQRRQNEINEKKKEIQKLQRKYFGPEGELYQKRQELVKPIQEEVYSAIETIASRGNYAVIFDAAGQSNILYTDPNYDKSDDVLKELGYKK
ncbi:MAG: OmpH family outer membrane protein [Bacteroidales bacterium]|nr:OmpH family outer membrane protein [Bacteroidales bacterium]